MTVSTRVIGLISIIYLVLMLPVKAQEDVASRQLNAPVVESAFETREPTPEELRRYDINSQIEQAWGNLFEAPEDGKLHLEVAKLYNLLGNGDIAEHEINRALQLGLIKSQVIAELGKAYLSQGKYDQILQEISIDETPVQDHGEVYLVLAHLNYALGDMEQAFINYYQAQQFLNEARLELNKPLAILYEMMGDYEKAESNIDLALGFTPMDADLLMLKGDLVHRRLGAEHSFNYYEQAVFFNPNANETAVKYAGALYNLKRNAEAMVVLRKILARDDRHAFANFLVATLFVEGNNIRTAARYMARAGSSAYDDFAPGLLLKGKLEYATGNFQDSEVPLKRLLRIEPDNLDGRRVLGAALLRTGKYREAVKVLTYLADKNMLDDNDLLLIGNANLLAGNFDEGSVYLGSAANASIDRISEAKRRSLNSFESGHNFGVDLNLDEIFGQSLSSINKSILEAFRQLENKNYDKALEIGSEITQRARNNPVGYDVLGLAYFGQAKLDDARSNFIKSIDVDNNYHQARLNLAKLELSTGNRNAAISLINDILARNEKYIPAYDFLFEQAKEEGDLIRAERYLTTAVMADNLSIATREKLVNFYLAENNLVKARNAADRMVQLFPEHALSFKALGMVNVASQDTIVARENLTKSLNISNQDLEIYLELSDLYVADGEYEKARSILKTGLENVKDIFPLMMKLIELAKVDGNLTDGYLVVNQLKLDESTRANAFIHQGDLNLLENKPDVATLSYESARKAGANEEIVAIKLDQVSTFEPQGEEMLEELIGEQSTIIDQEGIVE